MRLAEVLRKTYYETYKVEPLEPVSPYWEKEAEAALAWMMEKIENPSHAINYEGETYIKQNNIIAIIEAERQK